MSEVAIEVEGLGKRYRIGLAEEKHDTLFQTITSALSYPLRNFRNLRKLSRFTDMADGTEAEDIIWALREVSFTVNQGEVVGVIGRNGAGKSTLLKILSRITEPTVGRAWINGRVSSLLEVGTGFHPELTGRENVYLNGTVLGMRKVEVDRKFDEIVSFSGVEQFIDTPVKRYSSGMKVRLAFSVAAHLEPEVLLIDEVLAVGDVAFQKKCLGKMEEVAGEGRTVLFVSHHMAMVQSLCDRGILLDRGTISYDGSVTEAVNRYITGAEDQEKSHRLDERTDRKGGEIFRFTQVCFLDPETRIPLATLLSGQPVLVQFDYMCHADQELEGVNIGIGFFSNSDAFLFSCRNDVVGHSITVTPGEGKVFCYFPKWPTSQGRFSFNLNARMRSTILDRLKEAGTIDVELGDYYGTGILPGSKKQGVFVDFAWEQEAEAFNAIP